MVLEMADRHAMVREERVLTRRLELHSSLATVACSASGGGEGTGESCFE